MNKTPIKRVEERKINATVTLKPSEIEEIIGNHPSLSEGIRALIAQNNQMLNELKELKK